jgi:hypothetical protein
MLLDLRNICVHCLRLASKKPAFDGRGGDEEVFVFSPDVRPTCGSGDRDTHLASQMVVAWCRAFDLRNDHRAQRGALSRGRAGKASLEAADEACALALTDWL